MANKQDKGRKEFIVGLRNAHALENEAMAVMKRQVERIESYPQLAERLRQHITETEQQLHRLESILGRLGESSSTFKDTVMSVMGNMTATAHAVAQDEILKNSYADFALENYEIASYISLCKMAEIAGHSDVLPLLQQTLSEETEMANWLREHIGQITEAYLLRETAGVQAGI